MFPLNSKKRGGNLEYFSNIPRPSRHISKNDLESSSSDNEFKKSPPEVVKISMGDTLQKKVEIGHIYIIGHDIKFLGPFGWRKCT